MQTVLSQDLLVQTADTETAARLKAELLDAAAKVAAKDGEIDAIKRQHASELAAVIAHSQDVNALDEAVASRIAVIEAAKAILGIGFDPKGKSDMAIRRFAAEQKLGEAKLTGKDDAYVTIVFDTLVDTMAKTDLLETSTSTAIQVGYAIEAYTAQIAMNNKLDVAAHGHPDIERAIRLSFGWIHRGLQGQNQHHSHV